MSFIDFPSKIISSVREVDINILQCHEEVIEERLYSFIDYLKTLEDDLIISSIIVCDETMVIVDGHHRFHALKHFGLKKIPVTFIKYNSDEIKAYYDDRIIKNEILNTVLSGKLLPPKSTKHVIWDKKSNDYKPILLISSIWSCNLKKLHKTEYVQKSKLL